MTRNEAHPITVEVVRNAIVAYADEMANALSKAAYNMMIYEVRDYCCGLIDTQARMISQNRGGLPIFLADLGVAVEDGIERYGLDGFAARRRPGHEPGRGLRPAPQQRRRLFALLPRRRAGRLCRQPRPLGRYRRRAPGLRLVPAPTDIYAEGLQMRSLKIYEAGKRNETLWQIIRDNIRYPDAALGDLRAQIASCQLGARRYGELIARYGRDTVEACIAKIWDQAEARRARAWSRRSPTAPTTAESFLDNDGRNLDKPLRVKVKVKVAGSQMTVDFSEMNPQVPSPMNSGRSGGIAGARVAFKALTSPDLDVNEGCFRPLDVVLPEGTMLSAPSRRRRSGLWSIALPTVIDTILKALAPAVPDLIPAAHKGDMGGCSFFGFRDGRQPLPADEHLRRRLGRTPERGRRVRRRVGLPGRRAQHAGRIAGDQVSGADREATPCAAIPAAPANIAAGSGVELTYRLLQTCKANINLRPHASTRPGACTAASRGAINMASCIERADGTRDRCLQGDRISRSQAGDAVTFLTAGGGGYGDPRERAPEAIARDIADGLVSPEAAAARLWRANAASSASMPIGTQRRRKRLLTEAMHGRPASTRVLLYGNAWQNDYLRYATDFGILEGQALAIVRARRRCHALSRQPAGGRPRRGRLPGPRDRAVRPTWSATVDQALDRMRNQRIGARAAAAAAAPASPRAPSDLKLDDETALHRPAADGQARRRDRRHPQRGAARRRRLCGVPPGGARSAAPTTSWSPRVEAFFRANGVDDNFQIIGVGGAGGARHGAAERQEAQARRPGDHRAHALRRRLLRADLPHAGGRRAERRAAQGRSRVWREAMEAGIAAVRAGVTAADIAKAENDVFRRHGLGEYVTSEYTRVRGHGLGLFADTKPHILEDVTTPIDADMALIVHPNTYHPVVGYMVLGDCVIVGAQDGCEVLTTTPRELFSVPA